MSARQSGTAGQRDRGFTLLEILVVILIIGILATAISLSIGNRAVDDRMEVEAKRVQQLVLLAAEEAQLKGIEIGLRHTTEGFEFLVMDAAGHWQNYDGGPLRPREVREPFYLELRVEGRLIAPIKVDREKERKLREKQQEASEQDDDERDERQSQKDRDDSPKPQIFLLSSGEITAFALDLKMKKYPGYYRVDCDVLGRCKLERQQERV